jgi:hypothetical protein
VKITIFGRQLWPWPRPVRKHVADPVDTRSLLQRWEDGEPYRPPVRRPDPRLGSMQLNDDPHWRFNEARPPGARCDDTDEFGAGTVIMPRLGNALGYDSARGAWSKAPGEPRVWHDGAPALAHVCPRCEAPDDVPHYEGCPFYDPEEVALFAIQLDGLEPITVRARNLDPAAWRPYLTAEEFAETFPGVPYETAEEPRTGDVDDLFPISRERADQLDQLDAEAADWMAQRAAAHADTRARMILAWQAIWQH